MPLRRQAAEPAVVALDPLPLGRLGEALDEVVEASDLWFYSNPIFIYLK